ncbi:MAG TPA: hypothetical protein VG329_07350 [Candidatus Dormibacteraeota bacterium]|jgi:hypothetical protein|nr:hypothetical protein [Candidatus Dormibacteraeota bacterium]
MDRDPLLSGSWYNSSSRLLKLTAVIVGAGWLAVSLATLYFVAQYFACIGNCSAGSSAIPLVAISIVLGLVPAGLTAGLGYMVVRGLWEDSRQRAEEARELEAAEAGRHPVAARHSVTAGPRPAAIPPRPGS